MSVCGRFQEPRECTSGDFREFFRALFADIGYDSQIDPSNEFSWAFHDATLAHCPTSAAEETVSVQATVSQDHLKALIPLTFWVCYSLELLGEFNLSAISLRFLEEYSPQTFRQFPRHLQPLPHADQARFTLDVTTRAVRGDDAVTALVERISHMPFPSFRINSVAPLDVADDPSLPHRSGKSWRLRGLADSWNYLEIGYLLYAIVAKMAVPLDEIHLVRNASGLARRRQG